MMSVGPHVLAHDFGWGDIKDHVVDCDECDGTGEIDDEECYRCHGEGEDRWGSFYVSDRGDCEFCDRGDVPIAAMYEGGDGREWVCLPCYVEHHHESCGCDLWRAVEQASTAPATCPKCGSTSDGCVCGWRTAAATPKEPR